MTDLGTYGDQDLLQMLREGNRDAFTEIYNRYMELLYLHARKRLKDEDEAEDLIHDLFITIWEKRSELNFGGALSAYLYRAVKNKVINALAHRHIKTNYLDSLQQYIDAGDFNTDEAMRAKELAEQIEKEVSRMPRKMQEIFLLSRNANLSHKEIAEQLGISDKTVKKQVGNAIKILKDNINFTVLW
ncbi:MULTISPECIES: RNA polymerase sigma factor [Pedobacter]|uniref:RNA polymerase sigma factor n=1 Tax=Pedobacter TaxID=84567 RepID=UPI0021096818|nr:MULTISPECIES: RNA polymerase sigma-70 factor [unclassified Pedobacter]